MADIQIPADLKPADGRFGCGPSKVRPEALSALAATGTSLLGTSHRQAPVKDLVKRVREGVSSLFSLPEGYEVVLGNGGSTAFWDIAAFGLVREKSQHLNFGEFSSKFAAVGQGGPVAGRADVIKSEPGTHPLPVAEAGVDVYALTHNETSTGVAMPIRRPAGTAGDGALVLVDATSGAGGLPVDITETDVYYFAPQKCFASDGGLWLGVLLPGRAGARRRDRRLRPLHPAVLRPADGDRQLLEGPDLQHPGARHALPAGRAARLAQRQRRPGLGGRPYGRILGPPVRLGREVGVRHAVRRRARRCARRWSARSTSTTAIDAAAIAKALRANGIVDTEPYRKLGRNQLRIAMFPAIDPADVQALTACIDYVVDQL